MRIAVHTAWDPARAIAEAEVYQRMSLAAARLGWRCCRTDSTREIEAFDPDVVLAEHFFVPKLTRFPTLGLMWNPPAFWSVRDEYIKNVVSYDGHLFADRATAEFVRDLVSPLATRFVEGKWFPTCQATELVDRTRAGLAYLHTGWDQRRHDKVLVQLGQATRMRHYGPRHTALPFDGSSVLEALAGHTAALCLHSEDHRKPGTPSARVFEAAAAGAVIISDENAFVHETFGDAVLYVRTDCAPERIAAEVAQHLAWIDDNPAQADKLRSKAHRIFSERFTFEILLNALPEAVSDIRKAWRTPGVMRERAVTYVVRTGERDLSYLDRALTSLERQTHSNLHAVVVAYRNADAIKRHLSSRPTGRLNLTVTESADTGLRSTALWTGLNAVTSEFYGVLDDDDTLLPNHVASCLATLNVNPKIDLAFGGTILVHEDGNESEPRSVVSFSHFIPEAFRQRNDIYSNCWLARRATLQRIGPDPQLNTGEDYYLLLRLQGTNFAQTWRLTAEYRRRTGDKTHSQGATEVDQDLDRIKRRLYFAPHSPLPMRGTNELWSVLARNEFIAGRILREAIKRRYRRKGLAIYLADVARLPRRIARLPSILAEGGIKALVRRLENRGADEYARRARKSAFKSDQ